MNSYLVNNGSSSVTYKYLRLAYAGYGISDSSNPAEVWHSQFVSCTTALYNHGGDIVLRNGLLAQCGTCADTKNKFYAEHVTADGCGQLVTDKIDAAFVTNSLLTAVTTLGSGDVYLDHSRSVSSSSGVYQTVGGGSHYLNDNNNNDHNAGTSAINPRLFADLKNRTTHSPAELFSDFTTDQQLCPNPTVLRDTSSTPDRGYHYDPLDYCWTSLKLTSATLTLKNGVAVGIYGTKGTWLQNGARFISRGWPTSLNRLARYNTVQEGDWGTTAAVMSLLNITEMPATLPTVEMKFTDISVLADDPNKRLIFDAGNKSDGIDSLSFRDCQVRGGSLLLGIEYGGDSRVMTVSVANSLLQRVYFLLYQDTDRPRLSVSMKNALGLDGNVQIFDYNATGTWSVFYNLFHKTTISVQAVSHDYNGFTTGTTPLSESHSKINLTPDFQSGPATNRFGVLGDYYYPASGANLFTLVNAGNVQSSSLGLDTYTTQPDQTLDSGTVDIGFHYLVGEPTLTVECLPHSLLLKWTVPQWVQQLGPGVIKDFRIYRCTTSSGTCTPGATVYATVDDPLIVSDPALWRFGDTQVAANTVYCYRITFRYMDACDPTIIHESFFSSTVCSTICCPPSSGPFWTDYGGTPQQLAEWIMGTGITVNNVHYTGAPVAIGTFGNGTTANFPIDKGVILSTGDIYLAHGPNNTYFAGIPNFSLADPSGDTGLENLVPGLITHDAAVLDFYITSATSRTLTFDYIFASEEYPEWIGTWNDIMAIFIDGVSITHVPNTSLPVAVNNVNGGCVSNYQGGYNTPVNPTSYQDNHDPSYSAVNPYSVSAPVYNLQFDGTTILLSAQTSIAANVAYHVKIAIADAVDNGLDSAVFIKAQVPCP